MHLRSKKNRRFHLRWPIAISVLAAVVASVLSVYKVGLLPPRLDPRALEIGAASTTLLVDDRQSAATDLAASSDALGSLQARAALLGNLMTTDPVKAYIARLAGIVPSQIDATAPITANVPQTFIEPGSGAAASDLIASADHYKLQIQVDPTVPILRIYAQAPSAGAALRLASASVTGLGEYLDQLATTQKVNPGTQLRLEQLGVPHGGVVNRGVATQIVLLTFVTVFAVAYCATLAAARVRAGWRSAGESLPTSR
jgi:hypothetical protein